MNQSQKLTIAVLSISNGVELNKSTNNRVEITGGGLGMFFKDVLTALNMEYELVQPPDGQFGRLTRNGSWTGILGMTVRGESDIGLSTFQITESRSKVLLFSLPYLMEHITFVIKKPEKIHLKNGYLYPFHHGVWMSYILTLMVMSLVLWIVLKRKYSLGRIVFELLGCALRQPFAICDNAWMTKFLLANLYVFTLIMASAYSSILLSFLTVSGKAETVETVQQLAEAVMKGTHRCYVFNDILLVSYLVSSDDEHIRILGRAITRNKWYLDWEDEDPFNVLSPNTAIIASRIHIDFVTQGTYEQRSKYIVSKDVICNVLISFVMKRNFCCRKKLNDILRYLGAGGMMYKYIRDAAFKNYLFAPKKVENLEQHKISVDDITGALYVLSSGYALSFITLLAELFISKYCSNRIQISHTC